MVARREASSVFFVRGGQVSFTGNTSFSAEFVFANYPEAGMMNMYEERRDRIAEGRTPDQSLVRRSKGP